MEKTNLSEEYTNTKSEKRDERETNIPKSKPCVLVVDDSEVDRALLKETVESDYQVEEVANGLDALAKIRQGGIDLVILDIVMPQMDGFEVLKVMQKYHWLDRTPVIAISAEDVPSYIEKAFYYGAVDCIRRPYDGFIVRQRIANALAIHKKYTPMKYWEKPTEPIKPQSYQKTKLYAQVVDIEREKTAFFTEGIHEIQFEYDRVHGLVHVSHEGAEILGFSKELFSFDSQDMSFMGEDAIKSLSEKLRNTTPENPLISTSFQKNISGQVYNYRVLAKSLWTREYEPRYVGAVGRIWDSSSEGIYENAEDILQLSSVHPKVKKIIRQLKKVFDRVYLVEVGEYRIFDENGQDILAENSQEPLPHCYTLWGKGFPCKDCVARKALANRDRMTKIEVANGEIHCVVAKYIEIEDTSYIIEIGFQIKNKSLLYLLEQTDLVDHMIGYNRKIYRDVLTGTYNRRYYEEYVKNMKQIDGVAMIDGDNFKEVNDKYGHQVGDLVLRHIAQVIKTCVRSSDILIRYGGDEFVLLMAYIPPEVFHRKMQEIVDKIHASHVEGYPDIHCTVTVGAVYPVTSVPQALKRADELMYNGKREHKNMVIFDS